MDFLPCSDLFLLIQIRDIIIANKSTWPLSFWASWMTSMKLEMKPVTLISLANCTCHIGAREGHDQRAWRVSSRPFLQLGQQESKINFRRNKLVLVGNESDPTCHSKDQTLFGTCSCQILFQIVFITSTFDAPIPAISSP